MKQYSHSQYSKINLYVGWFSFLVAAIVYLLTIEPTASFWDCGEFIVSGNTLQVGHPPGAPFFMLLMRLFTMLAPTKELIPVFGNTLSALASAFTILFLFWSITHLARKMTKTENNSFTLTQIILIMGAGLVGALTYTFSDSFWFSAVEAEVYATSSLFTALVFWAILKWEDVAHEAHSNRWIVLIAYLMGLSIGVHLLNLLAIPAIVMLYYFKKYEVTPWGVVKALALSVVLLGIMMYGIVQGFIVLASKFELLFVNGFKMPYKSGVTFYLIAVIALLVWGIIHTHKKAKPILNTILVSFAAILIGYSSFAIIVIRSSANPPMDQNSPDNMFSLLYYLNREQYGDRPLVVGQNFDAPVINRTDGKAQYIQKDGKYEITAHKANIEYDSRFTTVFPRMYSSDPSHIQAYKQWSNFKGKPIKITNRMGEPEVVRVATFGENLRFFFSYQLGHMYWRYFMWNFAGRQNDLQGHGEITKGNWISGIPFVDSPRLGSQKDLPSTLKNKAHNRYFMLPFILGIVGMIVHYLKNQKDFWVVLLLFVLTGIAIVVYLNQTPYQPRERDYAYVGSFYAFSIWIGFGVLGLYQAIKRIFSGSAGAIITSVTALVLVPGIMLAENWDDHNRSGSYLPVDFAHNALIGCEPNAILFTYGDNDTFPLWYAQEVEGIRTDVRVSNLSYLRADWYIEQMLRKAHDSDPFPVSMVKEHIEGANRDIILNTDRLAQPLEIRRAMDFVLSDMPETKMPSPFEHNKTIDFFPTRNLFLPVDRNMVKKQQVVSPNKLDHVVDTMSWRLPTNYMFKDGLVLMDLMATNSWQRPLYFAITVSTDTYQNLDKYFQMEGLTYRIVPIDAPKQGGRYGMVDSDRMYDNLMNKYRFRGINNKKVYINENSNRIISNYRNIFGRLAEQLNLEGKSDSAIAVLNRCMEVVPHQTVPFNFFALPLIEGYYKANDIEKAVEYSKIYMNQCSEELLYYLTVPSRFTQNINRDLELSVYILQELYRMAVKFEAQEHSQELEELFNVLG